jgi:transgelin
MASVSSLDKDLRHLRRGKYTPQLAKRTLEWIEGVLGENLRQPDLLAALKDGSVLCR